MLASTVALTSGKRVTRDGDTPYAGLEECGGMNPLWLAVMVLGAGGAGGAGGG